MSPCKPNAQVSDTTGDAIKYKSPLHKNHYAIHPTNNAAQTKWWHKTGNQYCSFF